MRISLDTETTGLDLRHGARPFLVTWAWEEDDDIYNDWVEWSVDPYTRKVRAKRKDLLRIQELVSSASEVVFQNPKFDLVGLSQLFGDFGLTFNWSWGKVRDTLLAGHLLKSNQAHNLTTMTLVYLGINVQPFEDGVERCTKACRSLAQGRNPMYTWRIAKKDLQEMPSAKESTWKYDMWLPRYVARLEEYPKGECTVVNKRRDKFDVYIGRGSKWGNPFMIGQDGTRSEVIDKYREYLQGRPDLLAALPELDGKVLGCFCKPGKCHGDVLAEELVKLRHEYWDVCSEYANSDSACTLRLYKRMETLLQERGLWRIYQERLKVLPVVYQMEQYGVTCNAGRFAESAKEYRAASEAAGAACMKVAGAYDYPLELPKGSRNKSLNTFCFGKEYLAIEPYEVSKKTGEPCLNKRCKEHYQVVLGDGSDAHTFVVNLDAKTKRDTALGYIESYARYWIPTGIYNARGEQLWYRLHPSLNVTGTDTLRWSSSNPNEQNISKKEGFNLRYGFGPAPGREWWSGDAKNIELRIPAYESKQQELIDLFEHPDTPPYYGSTHLLNFHTVYPDIWAKELKAVGLEKVGPHCKDKYASSWYQYCKNGGFAVQYGAVEIEGKEGTADKAFHRLGSHAKLKERFNKLGELNQHWIDYANDCGYVETLPDTTVDPSRGYPVWCGRGRSGYVKPTIPLNYHVQSTAMWWMMKAMIRVQEYLDQINGSDPKYFMVMQVHDELVFDFPQGRGKEPWRTNLPKIRRIRRLMEQGGNDIGMPTPVQFSYHDNNWSEGIMV